MHNFDIFESSSSKLIAVYSKPTYNCHYSEILKEKNILLSAV